MERMKKIRSFHSYLVFATVTCLGLILFPLFLKSQEKSVQTIGESKMLEHVHWLGQSGIKITGDKIIYIDPFDIPEGETADLIFITHEHHDHLSEKDLKKIQGDHTTIVIPESCKDKVKGHVKSVRPGDIFELDGIQVQVVPAYNISKPYHPKSKNYVGYILTVGDVTYYQAGDTDRIPEMKSIRADVVFLPVGGTYTMNPEEAAEAVRDIHPKVAVPIHWGSVVGSKEDALRFQSLCDCEVQILETEK
jgi:L-ascorbate metabolism protein UlaG (beta-lactamase superfamily)